MDTNTLYTDKILSGIGNRHPTSTDQISGEDAIDLQDGRRSWSRLYREKTAEDVKSGISESVSKKDNWKINPDKITLFKSFTEYLSGQHVRVIIFLAPWHPETYQKFKTEPGNRMVLELEDYIRKYAEEKNITVIGSYDPTRYNLTSSDFYDATHPKPDAVSRIFAAGDIGRL